MILQFPKAFKLTLHLVSSALIQEDYTHKSDLFLFFDRVGLPPPVVSSTQARVRAKADGCVEGPESFLCALQLSIAEDDQLQSVDPDTVTVTIMDSDCKQSHHVSNCIKLNL